MNDSIQSLEMQHKLRRIEKLDARITRAKGAEREALARGTLIGIALFFILGSWTPTFGEELPVFVRAAFGVAFCGAEFLVRRLFRRGMERDLDALTGPAEQP